MRSNGERLGGELAQLTRELGELSTSTNTTWKSTDGSGSPEGAPGGQPDARRAAGVDSAGTPRASSCPARAPSLRPLGTKARSTALDMALGGMSREETDRHLAENFRVDDREKLLDEIYARVGQEKS